MLNPRAARRRAREQSYRPINNKSSETSGAIFHVSSLVFGEPMAGVAAGGWKKVE